MAGPAAAPPPVTAPAPVSAPVRVYMRADSEPLTFSARLRSSSTSSPTWCSSPCDAQLLPGPYQLKLNGVPVEGPVVLKSPGTLRGELNSREAERQAGWLALNVGGIIGGVFVTVAALGGPSWAYIAGGGTVAAGGVVFLVTYRADSARVTFTPGDPSDVRGLPLPASGAGPSSAAAWSGERDGKFAAQTGRGLGFRVLF